MNKLKQAVLSFGPPPKIGHCGALLNPVDERRWSFAGMEFLRLHDLSFPIWTSECQAPTLNLYPSGLGNHS